MQIEDILLGKHKGLITVSPEASVADAVETLATNNIGAVPVADAEGALVGIISERDIVRCIAERGREIQLVAIGEVMTKDVITCAPQDDVSETMGVMNERSIRHIPVIEDGRATTMISSRDVMGAVLEETREQRRTLAVAYELVR